MLLPKRVMEDNGLHFYHQPYELAIFPQMAYQLGLSIVHAVGFPEAGNVLSWGVGAGLRLLIAGVVADLTKKSSAGWMTGDCRRRTLPIGVAHHEWPARPWRPFDPRSMSSGSPS